MLKLACNLVIPFIRDSTREKEKDADGQVAWSTLLVSWSSDICPEEDLSRMLMAKITYRQLDPVSRRNSSLENVT